MYKVIVNNTHSFLIHNEESSWYVGKEAVSPDIRQISANSYHVLHNGHSYRVSFSHENAGSKNTGVWVNGNFYTCEIKDKYDQLLIDLGIEHSTSTKAEPVKSPMPGKVLEVVVKAKEKVKKGDTLLILEAMKMENVIKVPADGIVSEVKVAKGDSVEKNQILVVFED